MPAKPEKSNLDGGKTNRRSLRSSVGFREICLIFLVALRIDNQNSDIWYGGRPPQQTARKAKPWDQSENHHDEETSVSDHQIIINQYTCMKALNIASVVTNQTSIANFCNALRTRMP
jgi:hypothetical protein